MKQGYCSKFCWLNIYILSIFGVFLFGQEARAESKKSHFNSFNTQLSLQRSLSSPPKASTIDLLAQQNGITRVTGIELKQTPQGLEVILTTVAKSERLVPLILPEGKDLVIDILDATLAFSIRNGVEKLNPAEGINKITVNKVDESSIQVRISGANQLPSAEVVPGSNLVLSVIPEGTTQQQTPDEMIEIIATREGEDNYSVPEASTATGTDTPIKDTPLSIQVVPQQVLKDRKATEVKDVLETVSGVVSAGGRGTSAGGPGFLIRGFEGEEFRDGITYFSLAPLSASDLESVEVLKGPASVLFGQGQPGGIINLVAKKPLSEPFYEATFTAGSFNTYQGALDFSAPLNILKTVRYRFNLAYENYESFRDSVNGERFLVSPIITWDISPNTSMDFYGQYVSDRETTDEGLVAFGDGVVDVPQERFLGEDFAEFEQKQFNLGYRFKHQFSENLSVKHQLQYIQFTPRRNGTLADFLDESTGELERIAYATGGDYSRFFTNAEVIGKFQTGSIEHQLLFGTEYRHDTEDPSFQFPTYASINVFNPVYTEEPFAIEPEFFRDDHVDTIGVYLQDQVDLLPKLKVLAGLRFDYADQFRTARNLGEARTESEQSDSDFTPRFGVVYQPIKPVSLYASYTSSFLPGFPEVDSPTFDPETGRQFEVGVKADLIEQLSLTLAAFDLRKQNVLTEDPDNPLLSVQTGELASRGIELNLDGEILPSWNVTTGYSYIDAFVSKDNTDIVDNSLANVPDHQFSLWTTYELQKGDFKGLGFGLGFLSLSDRFGDLENTYTLPGYFRTDAALFYKRNNWRSQLNIENLFDIDYFSASPFGNSGSRLSVDPGAPFTVSGTVSVEF
jgi:iron complex outermembrane recepter protein